MKQQEGAPGMCQKWQQTENFKCINTLYMTWQGLRFAPTSSVRTAEMLVLQWWQIKK
jgi:hypothetical protein